MKNIRQILTVVAILSVLQSVAQQKDLVRQGNKFYKKAEYPLADSIYTQALSIDSTYTTALYNFGNSAYLGGNSDVAKAAWLKALVNTVSEADKSDILYNIGGAEMDKKNYAEAIKLYKDALRRNPTDEQARYNLALAQELLKRQQQDQNKDQDQDKDKQDQNKDQNQDKQDQNKDQDQDKQDQDKDKQDQNKDQNQDKQDQNKDQNKDKQNQPRPQPSPAAQQMLQAIAREEQKTQEKQKGEKVQASGKKTTKDW